METTDAILEAKQCQSEEYLHHETTCDCSYCDTLKTLAVNNLALIVGREWIQEGIYDRRGWTVLTGIAQLALRYSDWTWVDTVREYPGVKIGQMAGYLPYRNGDTWLAAELLNRLPEAALQDRQNYAPTLGRILQIVVENPGKMMFSGYLIGPQRFDERISIDAIFITTEVLGLDPDATNEVAARTALSKLELDMRESPDEVVPYQVDGRPGWRFWWD